MPAPAQSRQPRKNRPMSGDDAVKPFADVSEREGMVIPAKQPVLLRIVSQGAKGGFRAVEYRTVRLDDVEGFFQSHARHLGETHSDLWILEWKILNPFARGVLPTQHPEAAK